MRHKKFFQRATAGALAWLMLFQSFAEEVSPALTVQAAQTVLTAQQAEGEPGTGAESAGGQEFDFAAAASNTASGEIRIGDRMTIRLNAAGGTGAPAEKEVRCGLECGTLPTPIREGYTFLGWYTEPEDGSGTCVTETSIAGVGTAELYAHWKALSFRVALYGGGTGDEAAEPSDSIVVTCGRTWGRLPQPEREGFEFDGWYTAYNGGRRIAEDDLVGQDYIASASALYAHWKGKTVTVSFDTDGGYPVPEPVTAETGKEYGAFPIVWRDGYVFAGWYLSGEGSVPLSDDTIVITDTDHTLKAAWEAVGVAVSFDANGGKKISTVKTVPAGKRYGTLPTPEYAGHTFLGWYLPATDTNTAGQADTLVTADTPVTRTDAHTLYARWTVNEYTVTLLSGMDEVPDGSIRVQYGESYGNLPELAKENYTFLGWYTKTTGGARVENTDEVKLTADQTLYGRWEGKACTVTFNRNDGGSSSDSKTVNYGRMYGTLPTPSRTGYVFEGWYLVGPDGVRIKITKSDTVRQTTDHTLYAAWAVKVPLITLNAEGGSMIYNGELVKSCKLPLEYGSRYGVLPTPEREGYTFAGWHDSSTKDSPITSATIVTATADKTIYAHWNGNTYTVQFDAAGGTVPESARSVIYGETYGELPTPEKENYTFTGWYTEPGGQGTKITKSSTVRFTGTQTLYAGYRGKAVALTCNANGGNLSSTGRIVYYGEPFGTLPTPSRSGYVFDGWYTAASGGDRITAESIVRLTTDTELYAHWSMVTYKISFDANGGIASSDSKQVVYGEAYGALPYATRDGYTFLGWYTSTTGTTALSETDIVKTAANKTYYAKWQANQYTVTFAMNGGTASTSSKQVTFGSSYGTLPTPKRTGYTFAGWYTKDTYGSKRTSTSKVDIAGNHTLYAKWKSEIYVVTFGPNGGTVAVRDVAVPVGVVYSAFPTPEREGYDFTGWYTTAATASGVRVTSLSGASTLYARWQGKRYQVTLDPLGGAPLCQSTVTYGEAYGTLPTPSKAGFTFSGWYTAPEGGTKITATTTVKTAGAHTLYARWKSVSSKLSYDANGGKAITTTKTVTSGSAYGTLTEPTRTGYAFEGWYTSPAGGQRVTSDTIVTAMADHTLYAHWAILHPTIKFMANGGRVYENGLKTTSTELSYTWGQKYGSFPKAERTGYTFTGWYTSSTGSTRITEDMICEADDTLYAHWQGISQQVRFDANGGYLSGNGTAITVVYGETYGTLPTPVREGYSFDGWYTKPMGGEKITASSVAELLAEQTLYAHWSIASYTVTLDGNGGTSVVVSADGTSKTVSTRTQKVIYGGTYAGDNGMFPGFSRTGYDFTGFFTEIEGGEQITVGTEFTANAAQRLYAHWEPKRVVVTFDDGSADTAVGRKTVVYGKVYGQLPEPVKKGYQFGGWTTLDGGSTLVTADSEVKKTSSHMLYARWTAQEYTVSFDANGGTVGQSQKTVIYDKAYGSLPEAGRENGTFLGWYTAREGGEQVTNKTIYDIPADSVLYAHWQKAACQISFDPTGGRAETYTKAVCPGSLYGTLPNAVREGWNFAGWYTEPAGGSEIFGTMRMTSGAQTLYAHWDKATAILLFHANGGNLETAEKTVAYSDSCGELPKPTLAHYSFDGWYTAQEGGSRITAESRVYTTGIYMLYAHWTSDTVTVTLDAQGGSCSTTSKSVHYEQSYGELPDAQRDGYTFAGWYTAEASGEQITEETAVWNAEPHTLYAHWESGDVRILFDANGGTAEFAEKKAPARGTYGVLPKAVREGYQFLGWYTEADGGSRIQAGDAVAAQEEAPREITLYAHWQAEHYTVTFDAMGGSCPMQSKEVTFGEAYGELPAAEYEGYVFVAWYLETAGQNRIDKETAVTTAGDHTLYAYYVEAAEKAPANRAAMHFGQEGISPASGNVSFSVTDMVMNIPGLSHNMTRTYNSQNTAATAMGRGWSFGFEGRCELYDDGAIVYLPDGSAHLFLLDGERYAGEGSRALLERGENGSFVLTQPDQVKYGFGADGMLAYIEDRHGNRTVTGYTDGRISSLTDPVGRVYRLETDGEGRIVKITDPMENSVSYAYNGEGLLIYATNLLGGVTTYEYDSRGCLARITDPNGNVIQDFVYTDDEQKDEAAGLAVTKCVDSYGGIRTYTYHPDENKTEITDEAGRKWTYWYNSDMYITDVQNPDGSMTRTEYYENEEGCHYADVRSETDEAGNVTRYERDANGNTTRILYCDGSEVRCAYDEWNNCVLEVDENGVHTYHYYSGDGARLIKNIKRTDGAAIDTSLFAELDYTDRDYIVEEYEYYTGQEAEQLFGCRLSGLLKCAIDAEGGRTEYTYDRYGNIESSTDAGGRVIHFTYDALGHKLSETSPAGNRYAWRYTANGFATREYYPDGGCAVTEYDKAGHLVKTVPQGLYREACDFGNYYSDSEGIRYVYNASGRLESMTDVLGNRTEYTYDSCGNLSSETNPDGTAAVYEYDSRDRLIRLWLKEAGSTQTVLMKEIFYTVLDGGETQTTTIRYRDADGQNSITEIAVYDNRGRVREEYISCGGEKTSLCMYEYYPDGKKKSVTENGHTTRYAYDVLGNLTVQEDPFLLEDGAESRVRTTNTYSRTGELLQTEVRAVKRTEVDTAKLQQDVYAAELSEKQAVKQSEMRESQLQTVAQSILPETQAAVATRRYENGLLVQETDASGLNRYYTYDADGNVTRVQTGDGTVGENTAVITEATYDFRGNPLTQTAYIRNGDLAGNDFADSGVTALTSSFQYDLEGRLVVETTPDGVTKTYIYDAAGNLLSTAEPVYDADGELQGTAVVTAEYDSMGRVVKATDENGASTIYEYDSRGNLIRATDPLGGTELYEYDYCNWKTAEVARNNYEPGKSIREMARTEYVYDDAGRLYQTAEYVSDDAAGSYRTAEYAGDDAGLTRIVTQTCHYYADGSIETITDASGNGVLYTYHPNGKIATEMSANEQQKPSGEAVSYRYDIFGNLTEAHGCGRDILYTYDAAGRLLSVQDSLGLLEAHAYDSLGRSVSDTDGNGNITEYVYNAFGLTARQVQPGDETIAQLISFAQYDRAGNLALAYDTAGNRLEYAYDSRGNLLRETAVNRATGDRVTAAHSYDLAGNLTEETDAAGSRMVYEYDALGRVTRETFYADGADAGMSGDDHDAAGSGSMSKTISYTYDADGNCISVTDFLGNTATSVYDSRGRLIEQYDALGSLVGRNTYDADGRQLCGEDALGNRTTYDYDADGNLISTTDPLGNVTANTWDARGNLTSVTDPLGNTTSYTYDARGQLVTATTPSGSVSTYAYDGAGNRILQEDGAGNRIRYAYNVRNLQISRQDTGKRGEEDLSAPRETCTYTADGNPAVWTDRNGTEIVYQYDGLGRLISEQAGNDWKRYTYDISGNLLTAEDGRTEAGEAAGNRTGSSAADAITTDDVETTSRTYDAEGRVLTKTVSGIGTVIYQYDILSGGGRVSERSVAPDGSVTETTYDEAGRIASVSADGAETVHYLYNANGSRQATVYADGTR
ncbi:MAG: InlB B-repeat-containing protein, partial [Lachnospiraceae bacterium]|nr:InlB B-repeat-containing protein [Lachnospiraceae bacterium]